MAFALCAVVASIAWAINRHMPDLPGAAPEHRPTMTAVALFSFGVVALVASLIHVGSGYDHPSRHGRRGRRVHAARAHPPEAWRGRGDDGCGPAAGGHRPGHRRGGILYNFFVRRFYLWY